jgi:probable HAF family extracellular repeat protein
MRFILTSIAACSLLAAVTMAQSPHPGYTVTDLGPTDTPFSQATYVNNHGLVTGFETAADGTQHAVLWYRGAITDISKPGLGGPNSGAGGANEFGQVIGGAETLNADPNNENFCGYGTGFQCLAFLWQNGVMTPFPTLGGINSGYGQINNLGQVAGYAENDTRDPDCRPGVSVNGTGPQVLDFEPVIWGPRRGQIRQLPLLPGDTVGVAFWTNDEGQAVGMTGSCGNTVIPGFSTAPHAVIWEKNGSVHNLGNLGGTVNTSMLGVGTVAFAINNQGQVTGVSALPGNETFHPFLWTRDTRMRDLGVLSGDLVGAGLGINNEGDVVGASISAPGPASGNPRAFLWRNGVMNDLNQLVPAGSPLYLLTAFAINDVGQVAGFGVTSTGEIHAFLATPCDADALSTTAAEVDKTTERPRVVLSESAREILQRVGFGRFGAPLMRQQ